MAAILVAVVASAAVAANLGTRSRGMTHLADIWRYFFPPPPPPPPISCRRFLVSLLEIKSEMERGEISPLSESGSSSAGLSDLFGKCSAKSLLSSSIGLSRFHAPVHPLGLFSAVRSGINLLSPPFSLSKGF